LDRFEARVMSLVGDLGSLAPGAVIAPEIVIVERMEVFVDRHDARPGCVDGDRLHGGTGDAGGGESLAHCIDERRHVIGMRLCGVVGILTLAVQRVFANARTDAAALTIDDGNTDAQRPVVNSGHDCHRILLTSGKGRVARCGKRATRPG